MALLTRQIAVKAAAGVTGLALFGAGLVLLLRALWLALLPGWGPLGTAALMGGGLTLAGLLALYLVLRRPRAPEAPAATAPADPLTAVVAAFAEGYGVGQAIRGKR